MIGRHFRSFIGHQFPSRQEMSLVFFVSSSDSTTPDARTNRIASTKSSPWPQVEDGLALVHSQKIAFFAVDSSDLNVQTSDNRAGGLRVGKEGD